MERLFVIKAWLVWGAVGVMLLALVVAATAHTAAQKWREANPLARGVFLTALLVGTLYGGAKHGGGGISFPHTDIEIRYLYDAGSYVSNETVRVAFTRAAGVPVSASLCIDRRVYGSTNDADWVSYTNTTIAAFNPPQILSVPNATNWNWVVYTTWTPGSAVQTNGVWHAYWGLDRKAKAVFVPARTAISVDGEIIATPESRRKWEEEQDED